MAKSKTTFSCGHKGFGAYCHRCDAAENLKALAESGKKYVTNKKAEKKLQKVWTKKEMLEEAERLLDGVRRY